MKVKCEECGKFFECAPGMACPSDCKEGVCRECEVKNGYIALCERREGND